MILTVDVVALLLLLLSFIVLVALLLAASSAWNVVKSSGPTARYPRNAGGTTSTGASGQSLGGDMYLLEATFSPAVMYKTSNSGVTWTALSTLPAGYVKAWVILPAAYHIPAESTPQNRFNRSTT